MSGGESDAIRIVKVQGAIDVDSIRPTTYTLGSVTTNNSSTNSFSLDSNTSSNIQWHTDWSGTWHSCDNWCNHSGYHYTYPYYFWQPPIYYYQIKCPKRGCHTFNWLELEKVKPCSKCGSRLKAVSGDTDFEVPVNV